MRNKKKGPGYLGTVMLCRDLKIGVYEHWMAVCFDGRRVAYGLRAR